MIYNEKIEKISFQPVAFNHRDFLFQLFKECRPDLMAISGIDEGLKSEIIFQQFIMEQEELRRIYPKAKFNIVMMNDKPIGRLYIYYGEFSSRILQIGLLNEYRSMGIGRKIINTVITDALKEKKNIQLQVAWFNEAAYKFYEKIGFKVIEDKNIFYEMQYIP